MMYSSYCLDIMTKIRRILINVTLIIEGGGGGGGGGGGLGRVMAA